GGEAGGAAAVLGVAARARGVLAVAVVEALAAQAGVDVAEAGVAAALHGRAAEHAGVRRELAELAGGAVAVDDAADAGAALAAHRDVGTAQAGLRRGAGGDREGAPEEEERGEAIGKRRAWR